VARRKIIIFYAWQSDRDQKINRNFIRKALDDAAKRLTDDPTVDAEVVIDADTEGVPGTPPVTDTILQKIAAAHIFAPDLTFIAKTDDGKLVPNPNVMAEYGFALHSLKYTAMMPVMNTHFGPPKELPFDIMHVRRPAQYDLAPDVSDGPRRAAREKLSETLERNLRVTIQHILSKAVEQEHRFKRDRAIYLRLYPSSTDQPRVGLTLIKEVAKGLMPLKRVVASMSRQNEWGAINLEPHGTGIISFTQAFKTGELWGVSEEPFQDRDPHYMDALLAEVALMTTLKNYHRVYEHSFKLRPPFTIEFGATSLKDRYLIVPSADHPAKRKLAGPMLQDSLPYKTELSGFDWGEWESALREFMIELYDLAGLDRAKVLTDAMVAANDLAPR
jgi:hypothetical protein